MKALIVEDNPTNQRLLLNMLSTLAKCDIAKDGKEGVDYYQRALADNEPYDVICLDVMMPVMDGHEALAEIRRIEQESQIPADQQVKILMTTAVNSPSSIDGARESGCDGYLVKPIRKVTLYEELERLELMGGL
ncbi:MAG: response regulator [Planctomycetes bacterium]|nr:response regulator [Planctomycetota bacterium]